MVRRVAKLAAAALLSGGAARAESDAAATRPFFVRPPADLAAVGAVVPRGNLNPSGGHVRPVKHTYLEYATPRNGGGDAVTVTAMAVGRIVMIYQRQSEACVAPVGPTRDQCAPGGTRVIDEYGFWVQHTDEVTSYYDHLHELNPRHGIADWRNSAAGWISVGPLRILLLGINGAIEPIGVRPGEPLGATRNYFSAFDVGVVDTRKTSAFLGSGPLRYPTLRQLLAGYVAAGGTPITLGPNQPYPGEMFVNSGCFLDELTPRLAAQWKTKLRGDGSCGRPDWDRSGTLQGNWHRQDVTAPTFANMTATEDNAVSFSPYNLDPAGKVQVGIGRNFFENLSPTSDATELRIRNALAQGLLVTGETGTHHNAKPASVGVADYACYDIPDGPTPHSLLVYLPPIGVAEHVRLRYSVSACAATIAAIAASPSLLDGPWQGDYVR